MPRGRVVFLFVVVLALVWSLNALGSAPASSRGEDLTGDTGTTLIFNPPDSRGPVNTSLGAPANFSDKWGEGVSFDGTDDWAESGNATKYVNQLEASVFMVTDIAKTAGTQFIITNENLSGGDRKINWRIRTQNGGEDIQWDWQDQNNVTQDFAFGGCEDIDSDPLDQAEGQCFGMQAIGFTFTLAPGPDLTLKLFVNGTQVGQADEVDFANPSSSEFPDVANVHTIILGRAGMESSNHGDVDFYEVRVWNETISDEDMISLTDPENTTYRNQACCGEASIWLLGDSANQNPTASFTFTCTDLACEFDATGSSDPDGTISTFAWEFGDGTTASGSTASRTYGDAGIYTVNLTVTDNNGTTDVESQTVDLSGGSSGNDLEQGTPTEGPQGSTGNTVRTEAGTNVKEFGDITLVPGTTDEWMFCAPSTDGVKVFSTTDAGGNWTNTTISNQNAVSGHCSISAFDANRIAVSYRDNTEHNVTGNFTTDGGASWQSFGFTPFIGDEFNTNYTNSRVWWQSSTDLRLVAQEIVNEKVETRRISDLTTSDGPGEDMVPSGYDAGNEFSLLTTVRPLLNTRKDVRWIGEGGPDTVVTSNGGATWSNSWPINLTDLDLSITWDNIGEEDWVLAGKTSGGQTRVYRTTNAGTNWERLLSIKGSETRSYDVVYEIEARSQDEWVMVGKVSNTDFCNSVRCVQIGWTRDGGQTWTHRVVSNTTECACSEATLLIPEAGHYVVNTLDSQNNTRWILETLQPTVNTTEPSASLSLSDDPGQVRTNYLFKDTSLWVRQEDAGVMAVIKLDPDLNVEESTRPCSFPQAWTDDPGQGALGVTTDNRPVYECAEAATGDPHLIIGNLDGSVTETVVATQNKATPFLLEPRTGNKVGMVGTLGTRAEQYDIPGGSDAPRRVKLDHQVSSLAVSPRNTSHVAFTGPSGTQVWTSLAEGRLTQDLSDTFDSVQVCGSIMWVADQGSNEVRRYTLQAGATPSLDVSSTVPTDDLHNLRISRDCRYLLGWAGSNVKLVRSDTLQTLATYVVPVGTVDDAEMDPLNNYVFAVNDQDPGTLYRFDAYPITRSIAGDNPSHLLNPEPATEPFAGEITLLPSGEALDDGEDDTPGLIDMFLQAAQTLGGTGVAGKAVMGSILIGFTTIGMFSVVPKTASVPVGAGIGLLASWGLGLVPSWIVFAISLIAFALFLWWT